jgi:phosphate transport system protein
MEGGVPAKKKTFLNKCLPSVKKVYIADDEVNAMNREAYSLVEERIRKNPEQLNSIIQFLSAPRYLERVADHATNIAEDVIYLVNGEII